MGTTDHGELVQQLCTIIPGLLLLHLPVPLRKLRAIRRFPIHRRPASGIERESQSVSGQLPG